MSCFRNKDYGLTKCISIEWFLIYIIGTVSIKRLTNLCSLDEREFFFPRLFCLLIFSFCWGLLCLLDGPHDTSVAALAVSMLSFERMSHI